MPSSHQTITTTSSGPQLVQRGHTVTTETHRTVIKGPKGREKTKTRTVYKIDGKIVKLNWWDRLRIRFMGPYEKQAFLAEKLLRQERRQAMRRS